jgi:signal transduction histidine kinase
MNTTNTAPQLTQALAAWTRSPWGMAMVGADGRVAAVNATFREIAGKTEDQLLGMAEADLDALLCSLSLERRRVEFGDADLRAVHYAVPASPGIVAAQRAERVAEDLREPLASIYGFVELLLTQNYDEDTRRGLTTTLLEQVEAMGNIINESLQSRH